MAHPIGDVGALFFVWALFSGGVEPAARVASESSCIRDIVHM
jgi:hypothetical protein